jgi:hypothetical protein
LLGNKSVESILFFAAKDRTKAQICDAIHALAGAAMAHFEQSSCLVIVDRDGKHCDLALSQPDYRPTADDESAARKFLGRCECAAWT